MGRLFTVSLEGKIYTCTHCGTHLALHEDVVSKCAHGEAYLFKKVVNVTRGKLLHRMKMTGLHTVAVVFCVGCGVMIGWTYECAHEYSEMCREGKSVLERLKLWFQGPDGRSPPYHEAPVEIDPFDDLAMNTVMI